MQTAGAGGEDRIGALPDDLLLYLMSFLPSRDSVRTCVLAKRWRTLWKSVPALRIKDDPESIKWMDDLEYDSMGELHNDGSQGSITFVNELLRLRNPTPLNVCDIHSCYEDPDTYYGEEAFERIEPWLRYALLHEVQVLRVSGSSCATNMSLISLYLRRLELCQMQFEGCSLDLSSCRVLEVLKMERCIIFADIFSQSLRHLIIKSADFNNDIDARQRISAPNLIGLKLGPYQGLTPLLDSMPSIVTASITPGEGCEDYCYCSNLSCDGCDGRGGGNEYSVVLQGLSGATNLELTIYDPTMFLFRKDLKWRPMFSRLKTLLLNDWCVVNDFTGLLYFLQHSPLLETLMLKLRSQYREKHHVVKTDESYHQKEQSLLSKHLKVVKIICARKENVMIQRILKILRTHGVSSDQINIQKSLFASAHSSMPMVQNGVESITMTESIK